MRKIASRHSNPHSLDQPNLARAIASGYRMTVSNTRDTSGAAEELKGLRILLVEDSWHVGVSMTRLLRVLGATVVGPAATGAEADRLLADMVPDVALVDFHLRDGESAADLIDRFHDRGITVVVITGYAVLPVSPKNVAAILQKPVNVDLLLATLRPLVAQKVAR
jgi:CheY-like chemotaxis protein